MSEPMTDQATPATDPPPPGCRHRSRRIECAKDRGRYPGRSSACSTRPPKTSTEFRSRSSALCLPTSELKNVPWSGENSRSTSYACNLHCCARFVPVHYFPTGESRMISVADFFGMLCSVVESDGQRTRIVVGGSLSGKPKKPSAVDWL
jgi:hypothetical protein